MPPRQKDIVGKTFNLLTVVRQIEDSLFHKLGPEYLCCCECGGEVISRHYAIVAGMRKSCGCLVSKNSASRYKDRSKHYLYNTHRSMVRRCTDPSHDSFDRYSLLGVCERWLSKEDGFENFVEDMGERPEGFSLDRIDTLKGYSPENCRWTSRSMQSFNRKVTSDKYPGIVNIDDGDRWGASITVNSKRIWLGTFLIYEDALQARLDAEIQYFGESPCK